MAPRVIFKAIEQQRDGPTRAGANAAQQFRERNIFRRRERPIDLVPNSLRDGLVEAGGERLSLPLGRHHRDKATANERGSDSLVQQCSGTETRLGSQNDKSGCLAVFDNFINFPIATR